ncbi:ATP-binding protein [Streptomyces zaomyceticus]|uniref:ATP-binding protein n=1 Tax=Streptomyces zaomyceticus TaxID=68286 RepID=A0ABZ1LIS4_9ACTN|nr:ATP-binding protein [Streptomyces zaomyceticus]
MTAGHRTLGRNPLLVPRDASEARARVAQALEAAGTGPGGPPSGTAFGDALLVTSELVTNALRHGGGLTGFAVELGRGTVTVSVADASAELPHRRGGRGKERADGLAEGGFGWPLIRLLALEIRLYLPPEGGKTIEVRLPLH